MTIPDVSVEEALKEVKKLLEVYNKHKNNHEFTSNEKQICKT